MSEIDQFDGAFLSNSVKLLTPVTQVDQTLFDNDFNDKIKNEFWSFVSNKAVKWKK